ncbi:LemA family protein [Trueperella pecoris]|uniref:LemA family protein n=1 Tax=Trueperella pecoris TaxID=2733571 RepID=UPI001ABDFE8F|nr:LemA family protein [Trueperella pecoris]QTG76133.1 LemA family protein [Trueperella pecoris]
MSTPFIVLAIVAVLIVVFMAWLILTYNRFVTLRENVRNAMGQIATQIESRWDALTSVIAAAKQYAEHEAGTLLAVTKDRSPLRPSSTPADVAADDVSFGTVLGRFNALAEAYPQLRASETYQSAMNEVTRFEDNVRHSRMFYNDAVTMLNRYRGQFPSMIVGALFGFAPETYFENTGSKSEMPSWS